MDAYRDDIAVGERQVKLLREVIGDLIKTGPATLHAGDDDGDST